MDAQVFINSIDVSSYLLKITRNQNYCSVSQEFTLELDISYPNTIDPYAEVVIYEEGTKVLTGFAALIEKSAPNATISIKGHDTYKRAMDFFVSDRFTTGERQAVRYWIEFFLDMCGLSYSFTSGNGPFVVADQEMGLDKVSNLIDVLLPYAGWYGKVDANGVCVFGKVSKTFSGITIIQEDSILTDGFDKSYDKTRNVALVFGGVDTSNNDFELVFAKAKAKSSFLPVDQTVVVGNSLIGDQESAQKFANDLIKEFSKPNYIKKLQIVGNPLVKVAQNIEVFSDMFTGTALITTFTSSFSDAGYVMDLTLDDFCPRLTASIRQQEILYAGTAGSGVWKTSIYADNWVSISNGLDNLYVNDLSVDEGLFIAATPSGIFTKINREPWYYEDLPPMIASGVSLSGVLSYPAVYANSFEDSLYAIVVSSGLATNHTWLYRGTLDNTGYFVWSGFPLALQGDLTYYGGGYTGLDMEGYQVDKYIVAERAKLVNAGALIAGKPTSSDELDLYFADDVTRNVIVALGHEFNEIVAVKVSPDGNRIAIIGKLLTDTTYSLYIAATYSTSLTKIDNGSFGDVKSVAWFNDSVFVLLNTGSTFYYANTNFTNSMTAVPTISSIANDIDVSPLNNGDFAWIYTASSPRQIRTANIDGTGNTLVYSTIRDTKDFILWYPDGTKLLYNERVFGGLYQFFKIDSDGTDVVTLDSQDVNTKLNAEFIDTSGENYIAPELDSSSSLWHFYYKPADHSETFELVLDSSGVFNPTIKYDGSKVAYIRENPPSAHELKTSSIHSNTSTTIINNINLSLGSNVNPIYATTDNRIIVNTDFRQVEIINDDGTNRSVLFQSSDLWSFLAPYFDPSFSESNMSYIPMKWVREDKLLILQVAVGSNNIIVSYNLTYNFFDLIAPVTNYIDGISTVYNIEFVDSQETDNYLYASEFTVVPLQYRLYRYFIDNPNNISANLLTSNNTGVDVRCSHDQEFLVYADGANIYKTDLALQNQLLLTTDNGILGSISPNDDYICYALAKNIFIVRVDGSDNRVVCIDSSSGASVLQTVWNPVRLNHLVYDVNATVANEQIRSVFFGIRLGYIEFYDIDAFGFITAGVAHIPVLMHTVTGEGLYDLVYTDFGFSETNADTLLPLSVYGTAGTRTSSDGEDFSTRIAKNKNVFDMAVKSPDSVTNLIFSTTTDGIYKATEGHPASIVNVVSATEIIARHYEDQEMFFSIGDKVKKSLDNCATYTDFSNNLPAYDITVLRMEK